MPVDLHQKTETLHWSTSLNLHHWVRKNLPGSFHGSGFASFGRSLLPWLGVNVHVIRNLSLTLKDAAKSAAKAIAAQWKSLDAPAKLDLDNRTALDYLSAEQGGVCAAANTTCCTWINTLKKKNFFFKDFLMWTIFKVFIEFVTILLLFYVLVFWPRAMWDLSSRTRDRNCTPCIGRRSLKHWTAREVPWINISEEAETQFNLAWKGNSSNEIFLRLIWFRLVWVLGTMAVKYTLQTLGIILLNNSHSHLPGRLYSLKSFKCIFVAANHQENDLLKTRMPGKEWRKWSTKELWA